MPKTPYRTTMDACERVAREVRAMNLRELEIARRIVNLEYERRLEWAGRIKRKQEREQDG